MPEAALADNPFAVLVETPHGGHIGWVDSIAPTDPGWLARFLADVSNGVAERCEDQASTVV